MTQHLKGVALLLLLGLPCRLKLTNKMHVIFFFIPLKTISFDMQIIIITITCICVLLSFSLNDYCNTHATEDTSKNIKNKSDYYKDCVNCVRTHSLED